MSEEVLLDLASEDEERFGKLLAEVEKTADAIVSEMLFPLNAIIVERNETKNEINYPVQVNEQDWPIREEDIGKRGTTTNIFTLARAKERSKKYAGRFVVRMSGATLAVSVPSSSVVKERCSTDKAIVGYDVWIPLDDKEALPYLEKLMRRSLDTFKSSKPMFGCCHKYVECSDAKRCLHENLMHSTSCSYRQNLEAGRIFYGKNKNI